MICLISPDWESSAECIAEFRHAETLNKRIFLARLDPAATATRVREWQFCDLFDDGTDISPVELDDGTTVRFAAEGLNSLLRGLLGSRNRRRAFPLATVGRS